MKAKGPFLWVTLSAIILPLLSAGWLSALQTPPDRAMPTRATPTSMAARRLSVPPDELSRLPHGGSMAGFIDLPQFDRNAPDLDVQYIGRRPRYPWNQTKQWPSPGETVTFEGHIANRGGMSTGSFLYTWYIDGVQRSQATHISMVASAEDVVSLQWAWASGPHTVKLVLDSGAAVTEGSEQNNVVEDRTNGLALGIWVEQSFYDFFNANVWQAGWGGNSFDDWIQRHVTIWNGLFTTAVYPLTPNGVVDRVRLDKVVRVPDGANHCDSNIPAEDYEADLIWGFSSEMVGVLSPAQCSWTPRYRDEQATWDRDMGLIHELNHARYLVDLYGLNIGSHEQQLTTAVGAGAQTLPLNDIPDIIEFTPPAYLIIDGEIVHCTAKSGLSFTNCSRGVRGTRARAHQQGATVFGEQIFIQDGQGSVLVGGAGLPASNGFFYREPYFDIDIMDSGPSYGEHSAYAWNRIVGQRPVCGNYNAPCNIGEYLNDIPQTNLIEVRYPNGNLVTDAWVEVYRARPYPGLGYARTYGEMPDFVVRTNAQGRASLGEAPFGTDGGVQIYNAVLALKIVAGDKVGVQFLDVTAFNIAYWQGHRQQAILPVTFSSWITLPTPPATPTNTPTRAPTATPLPPGCYTDNFNAALLDQVWTFVDPLGDSSTNLTAHAGFLRIQTPDGNHDLTPGAANAPRVVRPISGRFDIRIKETSEPVYTYQAAGLVIWFDDANFVWIGRASNGAIAHHYVRDGSGFDPPEVPDISAPTVYFRATRLANTITTYYSLDGTNWSQTGSIEYLSAPATVNVGMFLINNWQDNPISADFDFFSDTAGCTPTPTQTPTPQLSPQQRVYIPLIKK